MTCRAGLRGFLRGLTLILRGGTSFGESAALVVYYYNPKSALFCLPVAILPNCRQKSESGTLTTDHPPPPFFSTPPVARRTRLA